MVGRLRRRPGLVASGVIIQVIRAVALEMIVYIATTLLSVFKNALVLSLRYGPQ
jgi:hypothetical protein